MLKFPAIPRIVYMYHTIFDDWQGLMKYSMIHSPYLSFGFTERSLLTTFNTVFKNETEPI